MTIILAVCDAMESDIENNISIKISKEFDRDSNRTIGVFTKLDLAINSGKAGQLKNLMQGKASDGRTGINLKCGYHGVINRSKQDIQNGKTISEFKIQAKAMCDRVPEWN